jgi:hypothetical protein
MTKWPDSSVCFRLADDVFLQNAGDEALLVKLNDENVFGLNATGLHIVRKVTAGQPLERAIDELAAAYAGDRDHIANDVRELIALLVERGLLAEA